MSFWAIVRESAITVLRNLLTYPQVAAAGGAMQLTYLPPLLITAVA